MFVLDTDVLSILEWAATSSAAQQLRDRLESLGGDVVTTIICLEEQMRGWMSALSAAKRMKEQIEIYRRLRQQFNNLCKSRLIDFDELAAVKFQELKKSKIRVGTMDLKIAAIALAHDATVITGNTRDFKLIPGLQVKDWRQL
jgi:tRNA(fMet)-specific endonuclease VapC